MLDAAPSRRSRLAGLALTGLLVAMLLLDAGIKLVPVQPVLDTAASMGWPAEPGLWRGLGVVLLASTVLYAVPRTALFGAVLLTAYLGGAIASHVRIGSPLFSHTLFGVYLGLGVWGALWLRDPRLRTLARP